MPNWKNLLLLAAALLFGLLLLEGGARVISWTRGEQGGILPIAFVPAQGGPVNPVSTGPNSGDLHTIHAPDPWVWWRVKPNLSGYQVNLGWAGAKGFTLSTDAQGFRATGALRPAAKRVLVVGDSTAFGVGVDDADTWPAQLATLLDAEVLNAGVPGHSTFQALRMAEKYGMDPKPELVMVCAGFNDSSITPSGELPDLARALKNEGEYGAGQPASYFVDLLNKAVTGAGAMTNAEQRPRLTPEEYKETLITAEASFKARGIPLVWVRWPTQDEVERALPASGGYPQVLLEHSAQPGVQCVDLMPTFKALQPSPYYDFVHVTKAGNAAAAQAIKNQKLP